MLQNFFRIILALLIGIFSANSYASLATTLKTIEESSFEELTIQEQHLAYSPDSILYLEQALWEKYTMRAIEDSLRKEEHDNRALSFGDKVMRFSLDKIGEKPSQGYPVYIALHGGGSAPEWLNDSQWNHMKIYYKNSVTTGIYIAPRGITNTWDLHFVEESYALYDRLIENLIVYEGADPNRIYLLGFSAGGDGVYHITPKMPDRWAAANMSAGHHNWVAFDNLMQTPFLMQMGERDFAYERNKVAAENFRTLQNFQASYGAYTHDLFLHAGGSHNSWRDNRQDGSLQSIIADPVAWLEQNNQATIQKNTNAVHWLNTHTRKTIPRELIWDLKTFAPRPQSFGANYATNSSHIQQTKDLFYWLSVDETTTREHGRIHVRFNPENNEIEVLEITQLNQISFLLHREMIDFSRPLTVNVMGQAIGRMQLKPQLDVMTRTLLARGDPNFLFHGKITIKKDEDSQWTVL